MIRTNHIRILFGVLLMVTLGLTISAQDEDRLTQDDYDLALLENGDEAIGEFTQTDQAHLFGFNGSEGDNVTIEMTQGRNTDIDPYLILLSSDGAVLAVDDDSGEVSHAAQIRNFPLPNDGTYLILATTWNGRRSQQDEDDVEPEQEYRVSVRGNRPSGNLDEGEFELFVTFMDIGDVRNLRLTPQRPVALVAVELLEGDVVSLDSRPEDRGLDTLLYLFNPFGERLAVNDDRGGGDLSSLIEDFEAEEDGIYLAFVTVYNFANAAEDDIDLGAIELEID